MYFILPYVQKISHLPQQYHFLTAQIISALVFLLILYISVGAFTWFCNKILSDLLSKFGLKRWEGALSSKRFFNALGLLLSAVVAINFYPLFIYTQIEWVHAIMSKITGLFVMGSIWWTLHTFLSTIDSLYGRNPNLPVKGIVQAIKIILFLGLGLFVLSLLLGRKPMYIITGLSALAAVFSLIFKDPILGFAASIQLTTNNLIKIGDWITVDSAGADGNIIDISLTSVRVQNFDMTIVSVPTYDLISKPFKNWSGMYEARARRIQRSILIDVDTIQFLDKPMLNRLKKIDLLKEYLSKKEEEVTAFNAERNVQGNFINGRHLTNIGTFRKYAELYLMSRPYVIKDNPGLTLMVRQLKQEAQGLPLEIYCFLNTTVWTQYEGLQSDIFDHLFSVLPEFGLLAYQQPSGQNIAQGIKLLQEK